MTLSLSSVLSHAYRGRNEGTAVVMGFLRLSILTIISGRIRNTTVVNGGRTSDTQSHGASEVMPVSRHTKTLAKEKVAWG